MAKAEIAIMLMRVLVEFDIELKPNQTILPVQLLSNISVNGIQMRFTKRTKQNLFQAA